MDAAGSALVIALAAFALSAATAFAQVRSIRRGPGYAASAPSPYEGPDVGRPWPLASGSGSEIFVAVSKRCSPCVQLLTSLKASLWSEPLTLVVVGAPLEEELSPAWTVRTFTHEHARSQLGFVGTPYAVIARAGMVAAHGLLSSARQLESMAGINQRAEASA